MIDCLLDCDLIDDDDDDDDDDNDDDDDDDGDDDDGDDDDDDDDGNECVLNLLLTLSHLREQPNRDIIFMLKC